MTAVAVKKDKKDSVGLAAVGRPTRKRIIAFLKERVGNDSKKITAELAVTAFKAQIRAFGSNISGMPTVDKRKFGPVLLIPLRNSQIAEVSLLQLQKISNQQKT